MRIALSQSRASDVVSDRAPLLFAPIGVATRAVEHRAQVTWAGDARNGSGALKADSNAFASKIRLSARHEHPLKSETTPEELLAAAHAACFSMSMAAALAQANFSVGSLETDVTVSVQRTQNGLRVTKIAIVVRGHDPSKGLDLETFKELATLAEASSAVGNAMRGNLDIDVDARLA